MKTTVRLLDRDELVDTLSLELIFSDDTRKCTTNGLPKLIKYWTGDNQIKYFVYDRINLQGEAVYHQVINYNIVSERYWGFKK